MADDLGKALLGLTNGIRSTMANVHSLNIAVLNMGSHHTLHNQFINLRNTLKTHWADDVTKLLQQIYHVIGDLIFLGKSVGQESEQEYLALFQETVQSIAAIEISCRTCLAHNAEIVRNVQIAGSRFTSLRHRHSFDVSMRPSFPLSSELSSDDYTFVHSSLSAAYPDLSSSASSTLSSLIDTQTHLAAISHSSIALRETCEIVLGPNLTQKHHVPEDVRQMYLSSWETNRQDLQTAFLSLAPIIDAITIEPSPSRPQRRRCHGFPLTSIGHFSTSANTPGNTCYPSITFSTTQSPTTESNRTFRQPNARDSSQCLPGKSSSMQESLDLDLVPMSCWKGFFFGHSMKKRCDYPTTSNHTH